MNSTVWWQSKQLLGALVVFIGSLAQAKWGLIIDPVTQGYIVAVLIVVLRLVTKGPLTATTPANPVGEAQAYAKQTIVTADKAAVAADNAAVNVEEVKSTDDKK